MSPGFEIAFGGKDYMSIEPSMTDVRTAAVPIFAHGRLAPVTVDAACSAAGLEKGIEDVGGAFDAISSICNSVDVAIKLAKAKGEEASDTAARIKARGYDSLSAVTATLPKLAKTLRGSFAGLLAASPELERLLRDLEAALKGH